MIPEVDKMPVIDERTEESYSPPETEEMFVTETSGIESVSCSDTTFVDEGLPCTEELENRDGESSSDIEQVNDYMLFFVYFIMTFFNIICLCVSRGRPHQTGSII